MRLLPLSLCALLSMPLCAQSSDQSPKNQLTIEVRHDDAASCPIHGYEPKIFDEVQKYFSGYGVQVKFTDELLELSHNALRLYIVDGAPFTNITGLPLRQYLGGAYPESHLVFLDKNKGIIMLGMNKDVVQVYATALEHELGHALSLDHEPDKTNLMREKMSSEFFDCVPSLSEFQVQRMRDYFDTPQSVAPFEGYLWAVQRYDALQTLDLLLEKKMKALETAERKLTEALREQEEKEREYALALEALNAGKK